MADRQRSPSTGGCVPSTASHLTSRRSTGCAAQGLTGCKEGCAEGECGACSILVARPGLRTATEWTALNACLVPVAALDGQEVVTAEGLGTADRPAPGAAGDGGARRVAVRLLHAGLRLQHGGGVLPARPRCGRERGTRGRLEHDAEHGPNGFDLHALSGNLCRCTGYRPIRDAAYALGDPDADDAFAARCGAPPPPSAPPRLTHDGAEFVRPADLAEAFTLLARAARRDARRRLDRLGRRGQPARLAGAARRRDRPAARAAGVPRRRRRRSRSARR